MANKQRVAITIDVEAQPVRAPKNHVDHLIWGRLNGREAGLGKMMDIADRHNAKLTCFVDFMERDLWGEDLLDVGREISRRGHDLGLHQHPDLLGPKFNDFVDGIDLCTATKEECQSCLDYLLDSVQLVSSNIPRSYRSGAYRLSWPLLETLGEAGIRIDASYNPHMGRNPLGQAFRAPFFWDNGLYEVPVSTIFNFRARPIQPYNFNASCLLERSVKQSIDSHKLYLEQFFKRYGDNAIATLVMHSWSFFKLDDNGFFTIALPEAEEKFDALLGFLHDNYEIIAIGDLDLEQENKLEPETIALNKPEAWCSICRTPADKFEDCNGELKRRCPGCKSVERQRVFYNLLEKGEFGKDALKNKNVLHIGPGAAENIILRANKAKVTSVDARPQTKANIIGDAGNLPQIKDNSQDVVLASFVLTCAEQPEKIIDEAWRVLKPGGLLLCHDPLKPGQTEAFSKEKIEEYYGKDDLDKFRVGTFRTFGEEDYPSYFEEKFVATLLFDDDKPTGLRQGWMKAEKRPCLLTEELLRSGEHEYFKNNTEIEAERLLAWFGRHQVNYAQLDKILKANSILIFELNRSKIPETDPNMDWPPFQATIPAGTNPYEYISLRELTKYFSAAQKDDEDRFYLYYCAKIVCDWLDCYGLWKDRNKMDKHSRNIVWNDAAIAQRLIIAAATLLGAKYWHLSLPEASQKKIARLIIDHFYALALDEAYNNRTNHSFFQNLAIIIIAEIFHNIAGAKAASQLAQKRILEFLEAKVSNEGILKEHTPYYQFYFYYIHKFLIDIAELPNDFKEKITEWINKLATGTMLLSNNLGELLPLGDFSYPYKIPMEIYGEIKAIAQNQNSCAQAYPDAGYAVAKANNGASILVMAGAFHSRTHKHCDDLSIVWIENNKFILDDAGFFWNRNLLPREDPLWAKGFWYSHPARIFTESPQAHNMVEINGEPYSRKGDPYGALPLKIISDQPDQIIMQGEWQRPEGFTQTRVLYFSPGKWLIIQDKIELTSAQTISASQSFFSKSLKKIFKSNPIKNTALTNQSAVKFSQWFHINTSATLNKIGKVNFDNNEVSCIEFELMNKPLYCYSLVPAEVSMHFGEITPRFNGWTSFFDYNEEKTFLMPSWTIGLHRTGINVNFITLFALDRECINIKKNFIKQTYTLKFSDKTKADIKFIY